MDINEAVGTIHRIYKAARDRGFVTAYDVIFELEELLKHPKPISIQMEIEIEALGEFLDARSETEMSKQLEDAFLLLCPEAQTL